MNLTHLHLEEAEYITKQQEKERGEESERTTERSK